MNSSAESTSIEFYRLIETNDDFRRKYNREVFPFFHRLAGHPLFTLPRLLELARSTRQSRPGDLYYDAGDVGVNQRWDSIDRAPFPVEEALGRIENAGAWITLHRAQKDPEYAAVFYQCMREFEHIIGIDVKTLMLGDDALIFITSPNRTTPYHIDRECNFLLQIIGEKTIYTFDPTDREVLPEPEIERFWFTDNNAAIYKPQFQNRAQTFRLIPGNGVHIPVNAPHWVQNDNNVSISLSVNFTHRDSERANVYRFNYALRKLGIVPTPPGRSRARDSLKRTSMAAAIKLAHAVRPNR